MHQRDGGDPGAASGTGPAATAEPALAMSQALDWDGTESAIPGTLAERVVRGFVLKETVGEGTYGKVKVAINAVTGERIAVKIMAKRAFEVADSQADPMTQAAPPASTAVGNGHDLRQSSLGRLQKEITIHSALKHDNVIRLYDHYEDDQFGFLLMELAAGGELFDKIVPDVGLDEEVAHLYFRQLVNALVYLHSRGVAHRDLKPENMLLDDQGNLKVSDFGFATVYRHQGKRRTLTTPCGSPPYLAPEVAQRKYDGEMCDVWSMGVILYVLLHGCSLWDEPTGRSPEFVAFISARYDGGKLGPPWTTMTPAARDLVLGMLHMPKLRFRLAKVAADPWTTQPNPLYGDDGRCADLSLLLQKMHVRLESAGEDPVINAPVFISFSQPDEINSVGSTLGGAHDRISWFSQPVATTLTQHFHATQSQRPTASQLPSSGNQFLPSNRLTRFFTTHAPRDMHARLTAVLESMLAKFNTVALDAGACHVTFSTVDGRRCPLLGDVRIQAVRNDFWLVLFVRRKGDPLEFKRFYKAITAAGEINETMSVSPP
ncbi:U3 small nucleolar RNA-associated protein 15 [Blastocladiella emersonii ATCC 22665]|nr:U3 small nucleolar RNA-associated protein 15 [Blastocladiella emersonii ATCC 22665]